MFGARAHEIPIMLLLPFISILRYLLNVRKQIYNFQLFKAENTYTREKENNNNNNA